MTTVTGARPSTTGTPARAGGGPLTATGTLIRFILRRDRVLLPIWLLGVALYLLAQAGGVAAIYDTPAEREAYAATAGISAAGATFNGPNFAVTTLGGIVVAESNFAVLLLVVLVTAFVVIRHTRADEEAGRAELIGSAAVGRHARLAAVLAYVGGANLLIAGLIALCLLSLDLPAAGSLAFALAMAGAGLVFAGIGAVAAQVVENARTARGLTTAVLGVAMVLRAAGDASRVSNPDSALANLSWLSPLGWAQQIRAFGGERWWVLALLAAATVILVGVAVAMSVRRDVGAGLVAPRLGPPQAAPSLASPLALAWRLQRNALLAWVAGFVVLGVTFGAVTQEIGALVETNSDIADVLAQIGGAGALVDTFLAVALIYYGLAASAYAVSAVLRLRSEEAGLHAEPVLATAVSRWRWAASHLIVAVGGAALLIVAGAASTGLTYGATVGDVGGELPRVLGAALQQIAPALVLAGIAAALFGLLPRLAVPVAWACVVVFVLIDQLGDIIDLNRWVVNLSPFTHLPNLPGGDFSATPLLWLLAVAVALGAAGLVGFRRRDLAG
jgi:ABC-2 type transport system permease protein